MQVDYSRDTHSVTRPPELSELNSIKGTACKAVGSIRLHSSNCFNSVVLEYSKAITMSFKLHIALYILPTLLRLVVADTSPNSPGPFVSCSGIAVSSCPMTSGCCFAGACCGSGCCAATEMCVFPNTPQAGCCRFDDPTLCGSLTTPVRFQARHLLKAY